MTPFDIRPLAPAPAIEEALADILVEVVANGGSVGFMHPLDRDQARSFWSRALASAALGERVVLGAFAGQTLAATVSLLLDCPPNQPHRAEIAKMMTAMAYRKSGAATALLQHAERLASALGRTLLVLDTATEDGAAPLYDRLGYSLAGEIPDYALKPRGGLTGTLVYWKRIG